MKREKKTPQTYIAKNLDSKSLAVIREKYGDQIEDIFPLSPGQEWMLGRYKRITGPFFLQTLIRIKMPLDLEKIEVGIRQACRKRPSMRTAFAWRGLDTPFQVVLKNREPEIVFLDRTDQTLEELSEEIDQYCLNDRARGFDLEEDPLLRIVFFLAKEKDTCAVILSRPHLIEDGASQVLVMKEMLLDYLLQGKIPLPDLSRVSYQEYARWLDERNQEAEWNYWKNLLKDAVKTALPGRRTSEKESGLRSVLRTFSDEENKKIRVLSARYHATTSSILHAAWSVLLAKLTGKTDILFGTVTSGRPRNVAGIDRMTGCFMNPFPVRAEVKAEETFGNLARSVQSQILTSQEYAFLSPDELARCLGNGEGFFDHLLNFQNYPGIPASVFSEAMRPAFTFLDMKNYDNLDMGFCLYFLMQDGRLSCRFVYDENQFSEETIQKLADAFSQVMEQILADQEDSLMCGGIQVSRTKEEILCRIIQEVLNRKEPIGPDDNFASLGGDSIDALMVSFELEKEGFHLELEDILKAPTPRLLAPLLTGLKEESQTENADLPVPEKVEKAISKAVDIESVEAVYPVSAIVESYLKNNHSTYPQVYCFEIPSGITAGEIRERLDQLGRMHVALRSVILSVPDGKHCQVVLKEPRTDFFQADLSGQEYRDGTPKAKALSEKQKRYFSALIRTDYSEATELGREIALRVGMIRLSEEQTILYLGSSHLLMEGSSVYRILRELTGKAEAEPDAALVKQHFVRLAEEERSDASAYWQRLLSGCSRFTELPQKPDLKEPEEQTFLSASAGVRFTEKVTDFCCRNHITLSAFLSYSFGKSLMEILSLNEVCFPVAGTGRELALMHVPGMFVVAFPLRLTAQDTLASCQEQLLHSSEKAWVFADPDFPGPEGNALFLSVQNYYTGEQEEKRQSRFYMEIFDSQQAADILKHYPISYGGAVGILAETEPFLNWGILFDSGRYESSLIRKLSAEWIRQMKACIKT